MVDLSATALTVGPALLGCLLSQGTVVIRITEVEAYAGADDPAAHAFGGPRPHTRDLFAEPGTLYCYRSYGIHICGNLVCGPERSGSAVLLRGGEVVDGIEVARLRRPGVPDAVLARGPGNLGRVMGWSLADSGGRLGIGGLALREPDVAVGEIQHGPRVGVSVAHLREWRFWLDDEPSVSSYRRSARVRSGPQAW
ncbi:MAG: DNA-3-methyladenine glycosylase [Propionicimonas sp.]